MIFAILDSAPRYFLGANDIQQQQQHDFFFYSMTASVTSEELIVGKSQVDISERCGIRDKAGLQRQATIDEPKTVLLFMWRTKMLPAL